MLRIGSTARVFIATTSEHFRKGIDGLARAVREECGEDPFDGTLFCVFDSYRVRVKILVWDRNGFWMLQKRLERGCFERVHIHQPWVEIDRVRFAMLLEGLDTRTAQFRHHFGDELRSSSHDQGDRHGRAAE